MYLLVVTNTRHTASRNVARDKDAPQSVRFALHAAATCGFALAYAAMITHFLNDESVLAKQTPT